jgi:hypothetical protein
MSATFLTAGLAVGICGVSALQASSGEVKVTVEQTPPAVQQTIQRELVGARLEDIAKKQRQGKTVYETDIIKDGYKWEVVVGEDGPVVCRLQEGKAGAEPAGKVKASAATGGWRDTFGVSKSDLAPTGNNPFLPGDRARGRDGPRRDRLHGRDGDDARRDVRALRAPEGDDSAGGRRQPQVARARRRAREGRRLRAGA